MTSKEFGAALMVIRRVEEEGTKCICCGKTVTEETAQLHHGMCRQCYMNEEGT